MRLNNFVINYETKSIWRSCNDKVVGGNYNVDSLYRVYHCVVVVMEPVIKSLAFKPYDQVRFAGTVSWELLPLCTKYDFCVLQ